MHRLQTKTKWWAILLFALLGVAGPLLPILRGNASAVPAGNGVTGTVVSSFDATKDQHIDRSTILYKGVYYYDSKIDPDYTYKSPNATPGCDPSDRIGELKNHNKNATLHTYVKDVATGSCTDTKTNITLEHTERSLMPFDFTDNQTIVTSDGKNTYKLSQDPAHAGEFLEVGGDQCKDIIKITSGPGDSGAKLSVLASTSQDGAQNTSYGDWANEMAFSYDNYNSANGCVTLGPNPYQASTVYLYNAAAAKNAPAAATGSGAAGSANGDAPSCESTVGILGWIICPIIDGAAKAVDGIYGGLIKPLLYTQPLKLNTDKSNTNYAIWSSFRVIGDILLVIALLVIVFGQSLGGGLIDAYAVKKILPRILAAAILINLSYYLVALAVDISNILGSGIQDLIVAPFNAAGAHIKVGPGADTIADGLTVVGVVASAIGVAGGLSAGTLTAVAVKSAIAGFVSDFFGFFMLFVLIPALLIFVAIVAVLLFRQSLILLLLLLSPVAFALYCLPNTEQYFKKWWDLLYKTLLVYPIIATLFALSKVFAFAITNTPDDGAYGVLKPLFALIALLAPLFLIPFAFKLAGGIIGRLHEVISTGSKRGMEAIKGNPNDPDSLRSRMKKNARIGMSERNLSGRAVGTRLNPLLRGRGKGLTRAGRLEAIRSVNNSTFGKQGSAAASYESASQDSHVMKDLATYGTDKESRDAIESEIATGSLTRGSAEHQRRVFASESAGLIGRTPDMRRRALVNPVTVGYEYAPGEEGWNQAMTTAAELSGGTYQIDADGKGTVVGGDSGTYASIMNEFQGIAKGPGGRPDLAGAIDGAAYDPTRAANASSVYEYGNVVKPKSIVGVTDAHMKAVQRVLNARSTGGGTDAASEQIIANAGRWQRELVEIGRGGKGEQRDEADRQKLIMDNAGVGDLLKEEAVGNAGKVPKRVPDPADPKKTVVVDAPRTIGDLMGTIRTHQQDPNHLGDGH